MTVSLKDNTELKELITDNPGLPLCIFCSDDCNKGDYTYELGEVRGCYVSEVALIDGEYVDRCEYEDALTNKMADDPRYEKLTDDEFMAMVQWKINRTDFTKVIIVYVD